MALSFGVISAAFHHVLASELKFGMNSEASLFLVFCCLVSVAFELRFLSRNIFETFDSIGRFFLVRCLVS